MEKYGGRGLWVAVNILFLDLGDGCNSVHHIYVSYIFFVHDFLKQFYFTKTLKCL